MGLWGALHRGLDVVGDLPGLRHGRQYFHQRAFARARMEDRLFQGVFATAADALAAAPPGRQTGYDYDESAEFFEDRADRLFATDYPLMFWLQKALHEGARSIVDFGGNIGVKFYAYRHHIAYPPDLKWTVVDLSRIADAGRRRAEAEGVAASLSFETELKQVGAADVFFASGSLQYLSFGVAELLQTMPSRAQRVIINATPVHPSRTYYTLNSIGHACCAYRISAEPEIIEGMTALGYTLQDRWKHHDKNCHIPLERQHSLDHYMGFVFVRG